jgi:hypothetical protein
MQFHTRSASLLLAGAVFLAAPVGTVSAQTVNLNTMVFQGMQNLPQLVAQKQGFFAR